MLASKVKPIVDSALRKLTIAHPEWICKNDVGIILPPTVFDIMVQNRATEKKVFMAFSRFDTESLLKAPQESAIDNLVHLVELEANKVFKID